MRAFVLGLGVTVAMLFPRVGSAQVVDQFRAALPAVNAAAADWQVNSDNIVVSGLLYAPTREIRLFDAQVMTQIGMYEGVPMYADVTKEPWSIVYVPVGGARMRTYLKKATIDTSGPVAVGTGGYVPPPDVAGETVAVPASTVGTTVSVPPPAKSRTPLVESVPQARTNRGVWLEYRGQRWYLDGEAVSYTPARFAWVGDYRGFPVYRETGVRSDRIWIAAVKDGPLAPYSK
jgi:hypothetical protein